MNGIKRDADNRGKGFIVKILNMDPYIVLVMSAGNKTFSFNRTPW